MSSDWQMPRRGEACAICGEVFEVGASLQACLYEDPAGYARRDYCLTCPPLELPLALASWRTRRPAPQAKKIHAFDREAVLGFFQRMSQPDTPQKVQFRFVLALLLWRKKALRFERSESADDGREVWRFTLPATGEKYAVERPDLEEEQIESLSAQLEQLLAGSSDAPDLSLTDATEPANA